MSIPSSIVSSFGHKLRVRACGVLVVDKKILLVKHQGIGELNHLWIPAGGGVELGETIAETISREFKEETNLTVTVGDFVLLHEYIEVPLHAIELFYMVQWKSGELKKGNDPELDSSQQMIKEVRYFSKVEIEKRDKRYFHSVVFDKKINALL